jgi:uncharacterized RDD family membrane protein YckC
VSELVDRPGAGGTQTGTDAPEAGPDVQVMWRRAIALAIDTLIFLVLDTIVTRPLVPLHLRVQNPGKLHGTLSVGLAHGATSGLVTLLFLAAMVVYFGFFEILFAATPGKLLSSLRVIEVGGGRPTWASIVLRNLVRVIDSIPTYIFPLYVIGGISVLLSKQRQRLGDRLARTTVAGAWSVEWAGQSRMTVWQRTGIIIVTLLLVLLLGSIVGYLEPPSITTALKETFYPADVTVSKLAAPGAERLLNASVGSIHRNGSTATYPVRFTVKTKGSSTARTCTGTITFNWSGPLNGWSYSGITANCQRL